MKLEQIVSIVKGIPYTNPENGKILYDHVIRTRPKLSLELGFAHGVSSCYIAAALDELGQGELHTVDLLVNQYTMKPSIEELVQRSQLSRYVKIYREHTSYTWFLKKQIEKQTTNNICQTIYDFCYIDGSKNWTIDGMAFFCVDKLLNPNGWILFDDIFWNYGCYPKPIMDGISIRKLSEEEKTTPHLKALFELIVMQHPNYSNFIIMDNGWGWTQKVKSDQKVFRWEISTSIGYSLKIFLKTLLRRAK